MFGSWTRITWLTFGKRCVGFETRYAVATAGNRPERSTSVFERNGQFGLKSGQVSAYEI